MVKYACRQCRAFFDLSSPSDFGKGKEAKCCKCGSDDVEQLPSWMPIGFNLDLYHSPSVWKYLCSRCKTTFELPVPSGPTEDKQRKCPTCKSMNLERLTVLVAEPPIYCS